MNFSIQRAPVVLVMALAALVLAPSASAQLGGVEIRRTTDRIPHIRAPGWRELGIGIGYAQAQDALCTLAEAFTTYRGERAQNFGADARPARLSTFGRPTNLELDLYFRAFADDAMLARSRAALQPDLLAAADGYVAGYNRWLAEARQAAQATARRPSGAARQACLREPWVHEITSDDILRRLFSAQIAAGHARFIPEIVNARPAAGDAAKVGQADDDGSLRAQLAHPLGEQAGLGSNMMAFGREATGEPGGVLFGNPHWYWGGPDRFYQMHLSIPGRVDVAGVAFLGVPLVMIGFNDRIAWSHTVSAARRFGFFDLALDPADPTRYLVDGVSEAMQSREVTVQVRAADGQLQPVTRRLYGTRFGPIADLGRRAAPFGWGTAHALALRDINADNFRVFRTFFAWNQARSLDDFIAIQKREAGMPWVNTAAIGRGDGRVWIADVGTVPNVPDALRASCSTALSRGFAQIDAATPFLDGSRAACDWGSDAAAPQPGAMPVSALPSLLRADHVENMNDSHWLFSVQQPLEGFPTVIGAERQALSLRARLGHTIAQELAASPSRSAEALAERVKQAVLAPRAWAAERFKGELLAPACAAPATAEVGRACQVLARWSGRGDPEARGALLWDAFWARLEDLPEAELFGVPFSPQAPLDTPRAPNGADPRVAQALAATVASFAERGWALDEPLGKRRFVRSGGEQLALYGGCHGAGYVAVVCDGDDTHAIGPDAVANTYLQVVRFGPRGVVADTLLAHGEVDGAVEAGEGAAEPSVARHARRAWLRFPFHEDEIARDPWLRTTRLR
jgi:acyl-homoserine-lactone acylase